MVSCGLLKFAAPHLGYDLRALLDVGRELLGDFRGPSRDAVGSPNFLEVVQRRVQEAVDARLGLGNLRKVGEPATDTIKRPLVAARAIMRRMTRAEKRLILAAYLASRIHRDDDQQLFLTSDHRRRRRAPGVKARRQDDLPMVARAPMPTTVARVIAIYHHLARQPLVLGPQLLGRFACLRECGLIKLEQAHKESDARVLCCVELPLARAIATELSVDLAEYLCEL